MIKNTNTTWLNYLPYNVRLRLVECRTTKTDLPILLDAKWRWTQDTSHYIGYTKEDILASILYLLDNNGLGRITGLTMAEWHDLTN